MKLHEALNLYSLHKNPDELAGHDKIEQSPFKMGKWAWWMVGDPGMFTESGNSSLDVVNGQIGDPDWVKIEQFTPEWFKKHINYIDSTYYDEGDEEYLTTKTKFIQDVSTFQPKTIMMFGYDFEDGLLVCEHDSDAVDKIFAKYNHPDITEALNLYSLHNNPDELAGHDKVKQAMGTLGEWVLYASFHHNWDTGSGKCKASELTPNIPSMQFYDVEPFTRQKLNKLLEQEKVWNKDHLQEIDYIQALQKFREVVARMKSPATLLEFYNEEGGGGFAVFEHQPGLVRMALPQSHDNDE